MAEKLTLDDMKDRIRHDYCDATTGRGCKNCPLDEEHTINEPMHWCEFKAGEMQDAHVEADYKRLYGDPDEDPVNHPGHYKMANGVEVIDVTEQLNFCRGNAVKYICRAGKKDPGKEVEDLEKAAWYIKREIERLKR